MTPYLAALFASCSLAAAGGRTRSRAVRWLYLGGAAAVLIVFAGLRDKRVGLDTGNYVYEFTVATAPQQIVKSTEIGFNLLLFFTRAVSDSYATMLLLIAAIVVGCYLRTVARVSTSYGWAVYLLVTLGVYTFFFNGARQGIAAAICFAALPALLERKALLYFSLVAVAGTFHHTAVVAVPLYLIASPRLTLNRLLVGAAGSLAAIVLLRPLVELAASLFSDRYATYANQGDGGGEVFLAYLLVQGAVLFAVRNRVPSHGGLYVRLLNVYLVGLIPALASVFAGVNPSGLLRLHMYFSPVAVLMWPMVLRTVPSARDKIMAQYLFVAVTLAFFVLSTMTFSDLVPYSLNPDAFQW